MHLIIARRCDAECGGAARRGALRGGALRGVARRREAKRRDALRGAAARCGAERCRATCCGAERREAGRCAAQCGVARRGEGHSKREILPLEFGRTEAAIRAALLRAEAADASHHSRRLDVPLENILRDDIIKDGEFSNAAPFRK